MAPVGLLLGATLSLVNGLAFLIVGRAVAQRKLSGEEGRANSAFVVWWYTLAGVSFVGAAFSAAASAGYTDLALHVTLLHVALLVLFIGLWGLGYYLAYLFTGNRVWFNVLGVFYGIYYVLLIYLVTLANPNRLEVGEYRVQIGYEHELAEIVPFVSLLGLLLLLPQLIGAVAYFSLLFRVRAPMQRYRIGMVAGTFLVWFGTSIIANLLRLNETSWYPPASQVVSVVAAFMILLAYKPPTRVIRALEERETRMGEAP